MPMVEECTWAWLEIGDSDLIRGPLPEGVVASVFANRRLYLVLANYSRSGADIQTTAKYVPAGDSSAAPKDRWRLEARSLCILRQTPGCVTY
ncbi:MAG: hypothetical protein U9N87_00870 [Planctomycetota bacterium]|nr:hypothetical protein [Planctomycetota bacterium]